MLDIDASAGRPETLLMKDIVVPPGIPLFYPQDFFALSLTVFRVNWALAVSELLTRLACIRPSVAIDSGASNEDDLTMMLLDILKLNNELKNAFDVSRRASRFFSVNAKIYLYPLVVDGDCR